MATTTALQKLAFPVPPPVPLPPPGIGQYGPPDAPGPPPAVPTAADIKRAAAEYASKALAGDKKPLPPPFTNGLYYDGAGNKHPKVGSPPKLNHSEILDIIKNQPKPPTQLQLFGGPAVPAAPGIPQTFMGKVSLSFSRYLAAKKWKKLGKSLNARTINKKTRQGPRKNASNYNMLIELSTNVTGKHTIFYTSRLKSATPRQKGPWSYPKISRTDKTAAYSKPVDRKNKKWIHVNNEIKTMLMSLFPRGSELIFPDPLYPKQAARDIVFRISSYNWKHLPKRLRNLTGKDKFKFYITYNTEDKQDQRLYVALKVKLVGRIVKGRHAIDTKRAALGAPSKPKGVRARTGSFCKKRAQGMKDIFTDTWSNTGIFTDSSSERFNKKIEKASHSSSSAKNLTLYLANRKKALDYWEQEYYARQAANFRAGAGGPNGWPNLFSRYPYDPWTLQPAVYGTRMEDQWLFGPGPMPPPGPLLARAAQINAAANPPFPLPFAPFNMALRPAQVAILFTRMEGAINNPPAPAPGWQAAAIALGPIMISEHLPRLSTFSDANFAHLFALYEHFLRNPTPLQHFTPYPTKPATWSLTSGGAQVPAVPEVAGGPVAARPNVTWQQVAKNMFYKKEARKWARWMSLTDPIPIPGVPQYADYIILRQRYILHKMGTNAFAWNIANPAPQAGAAAAQIPIAAGNMRPPHLTNPYAEIGNIIVGWALAAGPPLPIGNWNGNFAPGQWNIRKEEFVGPKANSYPVPPWPANNIKPAVIPPAALPVLPLTDLSTKYVRRAKRSDLGGWSGGRRTLKRTKRKPSKRKTVKRN